MVIAITFAQLQREFRPNLSGSSNYQIFFIRVIYKVSLLYMVQIYILFSYFCHIDIVYSKKMMFFVGNVMTTYYLKIKCYVR